MSATEDSENGLIPQPGGRGALRPGGTPGNRGGPGRPSGALRDSMRSILDLGLPHLAAIAHGAPAVSAECPGCGAEMSVPARTADQLKALELVGRFGLGDKGVDEALVSELAGHVAQVLAPVEGGEELLERIHKLWIPSITKRI